MEKLSVALVGLGEQCLNNILPSLILTGEVCIKSVCDLDFYKAKHVAERLNITSFYTNYKKMFLNEQFDAVFVACTPQDHYLIAKYAAHKKIPIFVEKPPCVHIEELYDLIKTANYYSSLISVGMNFRHTKFIQYIKEMLNKSNFGNILYINIHHVSNKPKGSLWGLPSYLHSFLLAQAIHPIDLALLLGGSYIDIIHQNKICNKDIIENISLSFSNGISANILTSNKYPHFEFRLEILTDKSNLITINNMNEIKINGEIQKNFLDEDKRWSTVWSGSSLSGGFENNGYLHEIQDFINSVKKKNMISCSSIETLIPVYEIIEHIHNKK